ncbi:GDSL-type esterase/lipase family protein [Kitasatospora gansuensis]
MNRFTTLGAAAALLLAAGATATPATAAAADAAAAAVAPRTVRVMPLGDSITYGQGSCTGGGYRLPLRNLVAGQNRYAVDFVGAQQRGMMADPDHEGHPGSTIEQIRNGVDSWLSAAQPDAVLLHIGINDLNQNLDVTHAADRATLLVDQIFADRPGVTVIMQGLVPTTPGWSYQGLTESVAQYNSRLKQLETVEQLVRHFEFVDAPALTPTNQADAAHPAQMADGLHPNDPGYARLAQNFFTPLDQAYTAGWFTGSSSPSNPPLPPNTVHLVNITSGSGLKNAEGNYSAVGWSGWSDLDARGIKEVAAAATGRVNHVYAIDGDGRIHEKDVDYATGTQSGWFPLTGAPVAAAAITASSCGSTVHLAVIGTDGHLYNSDGDYNGGGWNGWTDHGGTDLKRLASAATTDNVNHLFAIDGNSRLQELDADYNTGAWNRWTPAARSAAAPLRT